MNTFFPSTITEWNKLDLSIRNLTSLNIFEGRLLQVVRPLENSVFTCHNPIGIKYLTRLEFGFSHFRHHKLKHGFLDTLNRFVAAAQQLKILFISSFTVPIFWLHEIPFSMKSPLLTDPLLIKVKSKLFKLSFMETQPILSIIST